jgi:hypothetical protein
VVRVLVLGGETATAGGGEECGGPQDRLEEVEELLEVDLATAVLVDGVEEILHVLHSDGVGGRWGGLWKGDGRGGGGRLGHLIGEEAPNDQLQLFQIDVPCGGGGREVRGGEEGGGGRPVSLTSKKSKNSLAG